MADQKSGLNLVTIRVMVSKPPELLTDKKTGKTEGRYALDCLQENDDYSLTPCRFNFIELGKHGLPAPEAIKQRAFYDCVCKVSARQKAVEGKGDKRGYVGQEWSVSLVSISPAKA
jgi:hypothetical protein